MESVLAMMLTAFIFVAIIAFAKWHKLSQERKLRDLVSWSAIGDYCPALNRHSYVRELLIAILNAQYNTAINQKHRITEDEKKCVIEIIEEYQKDIMRSYFKGQLKIIESKYAISGENYFMLALYSFLSEHQCDYEFLGHDMHKERLEYKRYGDWGGPCYDATYSLTDFAIVFHKMHYITYMYCKNSEILKDKVPSWNENNLKEILDSNQIQVSRV